MENMVYQGLIIKTYHPNILRNDEYIDHYKKNIVISILEFLAKCLKKLPKKTSKK